MHGRNTTDAPGANACAVGGPSRRLAHIDGLRGAAILLVLIGHVFDKAGAGTSTLATLLAPLDNSQLGVELFFALSGYLITGILTRERLASGSLSLRRFYGRRILRIWPAFYVFIAAILLIAHFSRSLQISNGQGLSASLFVWNYSPAAGGWWLGHIWSLSVEEQFYLLWPLVLLACTPRRAMWIALAIIAIEPAARVLSYVGGLGEAGRIPVYLHTRADSLLFGAAAALLPVVWPRAYRRVSEAITRLRLATVALVGLSLSAWAAGVAHGAYQLPVGWTVDGLCCATILLASEREGWLRQALSLRPLVLLGLISFSVYLWQQLFTGPWSGGILASIVLAPVLSVACGALSYGIVERPFLRLKRRFESAGGRSSKERAAGPSGLREVAAGAGAGPA